MAKGHERGKQGEAFAANYLEGDGWSILDRNWRAGHAEIDLVARRGKVVAFVEVKTRAGSDCGDPLEALTWRKRKEIAGAARAWLLTRGSELGGGVELRFDAVAVELFADAPPRIRHLADAWRIGDP